MPFGALGRSIENEVPIGQARVAALSPLLGLASLVEGSVADWGGDLTGKGPNFSGSKPRPRLKSSGASPCRAFGTV